MADEILLGRGRDEQDEPIEGFPGVRKLLGEALPKLEAFLAVQNNADDHKASTKIPGTDLESGPVLSRSRRQAALAQCQDIEDVFITQAIADRLFTNRYKSAAQVPVLAERQVH
ncbi:hypothetical protein F52700_6120 [Fusarium sp. NRRL 52700]|nr:hypothetical protein F52700_6120 [Fusarium sp. NRRL 52700]